MLAKHFIFIALFVSYALVAEPGRVLAQSLCPASTPITNGNPADASVVTAWFACNAASVATFAGTVGIGTTTPQSPIQIGTTVNIFNGAGFGTGAQWADLAYNVYYNGGYKLTTSSTGNLFEISAGSFDFWTTPSGTGGTAPTFSNRLHIDNATGNVGIDNASPQRWLHVGPGNDMPINSNPGFYLSNNGNTALTMRDSTNHIEFTQQVSSDVGGAALGTLTNHPLQIYTDNNSRVTIAAGGNVGIGTGTPAQMLEVAGQVQIDTLASASSTSLCVSATTNGVLATCSSSIRYKENVHRSSFGLAEVMAMRPVTFKWKGRDENDFGLIAEEVARINPLFVTRKNGKIEGVKYPQLVAVMAGAIKAQQAQIAELIRANQALRLAQGNERALEANDIAALRRDVSALRSRVRFQTAGR